MLRRIAVAGTGLGHDRDRQFYLAAEHVVHLGHVVEYLVSADTDKADEHHVHQRPQPSRSCTDPRTHEASLGNGGVPDAFGAELLYQPLG